MEAEQSSLTNPAWEDVPANNILEGDGEFFIHLNTSAGIRFYRLNQP